MRAIYHSASLILFTLLSACMTQGPNPQDPYEPLNRNIYKFNMALDATFLKPPARLYKAALPPFVRSSINNAFNNVAMLPTITNDLLQADWCFAIKDSWRFIINSTFGVGGLFDMADKHFSLPPHYNDMGLTFAKWGDRHSPYLMLPFFGPSTIRDGMGMLFDYTVLNPYAYIRHDGIIWGLAALRYVDVRSHLFETEALMEQALDKYSFIRDAYLAHRQFLITGEEVDGGYVEEDEPGSDYVDDETE